MITIEEHPCPSCTDGAGPMGQYSPRPPVCEDCQGTGTVLLCSQCWRKVEGDRCEDCEGDGAEYKLTAEEMQEAEAVMEEMGNDPDAIAYELVWRRHHIPNDRLHGREGSAAE